MSDFDDYLRLVGRLGTGGINRSENDLSSNLKNALSSFGLHGVIDTGSGSNRAKRPDIALYTERDAADVGAAADIVIESKKPAELSGFATLLDALVDDRLWADKFVPYVTAHAERIAYFVLTTFDRFLIIPIGADLRTAISAPGTFGDMISRRAAMATATIFDLHGSGDEEAFGAWCETHLKPESLSPPALSSISDLRSVDDADALEHFASDLADIVVGPEGRASTSGALIYTIRAGGSRLDELAPDVQRALIVYTMAANGGMSVDAAQGYIATHWQTEWSEFVISPSLIESGDARRVINLARRLRNLSLVSAEADNGMDAALAESLLDRETLGALALDELGGTGGRFRQRRMWRSTASTDALVDADVSRLRPELDEVVADLFAAEPRPRSTL